MGILSIDRAKEIEKRMVVAMERELRTIVAAQDLAHEMDMLRKERERREFILQEQRMEAQLQQQQKQVEKHRLHGEKRRRVAEHQEQQRQILADYEKEKKVKAAERARQYAAERQVQAEIVAREAEKKALYMSQVRKSLEAREQERREDIFMRMQVAEVRLAHQNEALRNARVDKTRVEKEKEAQRNARREMFKKQQAEDHREMILKIADKYTRSDRMKQEQAEVIHSLNMLKKEFAERKEEVSKMARAAARSGNMEMIYEALVKVRQPGEALERTYRARSSPSSPMNTPRLDTPTATKFLQQYGLEPPEPSTQPATPRLALSPPFSPASRKQFSPLANSSPPASPMTLSPGTVQRPSIKVHTIAGLRNLAAAEDSPGILSGRTNMDDSPSRRSFRPSARVTIAEEFVQDDEDDSELMVGDTYKRLMRIYESRLPT